jgi:hypothetical protein
MRLRCSIPTFGFVSLAAALLAIGSCEGRADEGKTYNIVFMGDSITQGAQVSSPELIPPVVCLWALKANMPGANFSMVKLGFDAHTTANFLPTPTGEFAWTENSARKLSAAHPGGQLIFSIMLGAHDSALSGPKGTPISADVYQTSLKAIVGQLLKDFPNSLVFVHHPIWHSNNIKIATYNYGPNSIDQLKSYLPAVDAVVTETAKEYPKHVFLGDTAGFDYFAAHYKDELIPMGGGYLQVNDKGAATLGKLWADTMEKGLAKAPYIPEKSPAPAK